MVHQLSLVRWSRTLSFFLSFFVYLAGDPRGHSGFTQRTCWRAYKGPVELAWHCLNFVTCHRWFTWRAFKFHHLSLSEKNWICTLNNNGFQPFWQTDLWKLSFFSTDSLIRKCRSVKYGAFHIKMKKFLLCLMYAHGVKIKLCRFRNFSFREFWF